MRLVRTLAIVAGLTTTAACDRSPVGPIRAVPARDTAPLFQTDSLALTLVRNGAGYAGQVGVTFTNRTGATVYFVNCNGATALRLEREEGGTWIPAWDPVMQMCLTSPIVVPAGASVRLGFGIFSGFPGSNSYPRFSVPEIPGTYRVVWFDALSSYQDHAPFGTPLPLASRVSNRFRLDVR